jgi:predicted DNA-binding transcriptional regulator YafY
MLDIVQFEYRNHRGEEATRTVRPIRLWFGSTAWHPEPQWLLECFDLDKQATRDYAMSGVLSPWRGKNP